jgi:hypothetical protein
VAHSVQWRTAFAAFAGFLTAVLTKCRDQGLISQPVSDQRGPVAGLRDLRPDPICKPSFVGSE